MLRGIKVPKLPKLPRLPHFYIVGVDFNANARVCLKLGHIPESGNYLNERGRVAWTRCKRCGEGTVTEETRAAA